MTSEARRFVFYGDACSGVPGGANEKTLARTNESIAARAGQPEFVIFAGDEIVGLTSDEAELRAQWRYWFDVEMAWLRRAGTPIYNTTSNHTTYDEMSERVFTEVLDHLPRNGPADQQGLSYYVADDDLLMVFVNTSWSGLGGEGHVETEWLAEVLAEQDDHRWKLVIGHHPVFPVNGFSGPFQRELGHDTGRVFWDLLVKHGVTAYLCSHILAFDVQVHDGVLQILSAGAGTAHRMPAETEYLHFVDMTLDGNGVGYEVIDHDGEARERLQWPTDDLTVVALSGETSPDATDGRPRALLISTEPERSAGTGDTAEHGLPGDHGLPAIWVGLTGRSRRLTVMLRPEQGRSPHYWFGPSFGAGRRFSGELGLHWGMGPGGVLWRSGPDEPWSSLQSASPWGLERIARPIRLTI